MVIEVASSSEAGSGRAALELSWKSGFRSVELSAYRNNTGITHRSSLPEGRFNIWRNSFPAEELPVGAMTVVNGVPFQFPPVEAGEPDNVRCEGQHIDLPAGRYDWLYLLACAERRVEDEIAFHFADGSVDFDVLRVSDFWHAPAVFGEDEAFSTSTMHYPYHVQQDVQAKIWCQRVPITRRADLISARLPHNIAVHVFAASLCEQDLR